jgi:hypothetical protein
MAVAGALRRAAPRAAGGAPRVAGGAPRSGAPRTASARPMPLAAPVMSAADLSISTRRYLGWFEAERPREGVCPGCDHADWRKEGGGKGNGRKEYIRLIGARDWGLGHACGAAHAISAHALQAERAVRAWRPSPPVPCLADASLCMLKGGGPMPFEWATRPGQHCVFDQVSTRPGASSVDRKASFSIQRAAASCVHSWSSV